MQDVAPFNDQTKSDPSLTIHASCCQDARGEGPLDFWDSNTGRWVEVTYDIHLSSIKNTHEFWFRSGGVSILNGGFTKHFVHQILLNPSAFMKVVGFGNWGSWSFSQVPGFLSAFRGLDFLTAASQVGTGGERMEMMMIFSRLERWRLAFQHVLFYHRTSDSVFFFVKIMGELFGMHRKASSFSGNYLPEL